MIKKLLTTGLILSGLLTINAQKTLPLSESDITRAEKFVANSINTQQRESGISAVPDGDTLCYFKNKQEARNTGTAVGSYYTIKSPYVQTGTVQPVLNEFGSSFLNPGGAAVTVKGAYVLIMRHGASISPSLNVRVYIYSASPTGIPGSKLDSAMTVVTSSVSGTFCNATFTTPVLVNGAFFISYKPIVSAGDTIRAFINNAYAATATNAPSPARKYGEGLSYTRYNGAFSTNTNFYGAGSDYENIVIPFVSFSYSASGTQMAPNAGTVSANGYCANAPITFTNTSGPISILENRQFNYNAFTPAWLPFANTASLTTLRIADPIYNWSFSGPAPAGNYTTTNASHTYSVAGTNALASLLVKYQHSMSILGTTSKSPDIKSFPTFTIVNCGLVGIAVNSLNSSLSIYPNPVVNGKATISGLEGINTVSVYNMIGQMISTQTNDKEIISIDLTSQVQGTYLVRISDSNNKSKTVKLINQ